ncbi:glycosyl hydrolase 115 family protein [Agromyces sp. LHK192]|uniref:glycosyl hydrolase 115 family protein n=1 Tax=Agromyces sp. LHK192 TaxID=2498704 RepID=UPI0013E2F533|nr:glycosyl hydrolase 115 family protein [Agromyces sp. LHK192]
MQRAVTDLVRDVERVTGAPVAIVPDAAVANIVVGTVGVSAAIDALIASGQLDLASLRDDADGELRWEGLLVTVVGETLYLIGTDRRGTIYAVYDFAEAIGVSPWYWWADVPVRTRRRIVVRRDASHADWPAVRFRGVFINDEEELFHWSRRHTPDGTIGPVTYGRVFELLLRLKGNYLWPAMHIGAFNHDPENGRLADEMGVVIGTSHCDMLLRSNEHEFRPWVAAQGEDIRYDYSIPGRNRDKLHEYWRGSVEQNGDYEVTWTVGIRGVHDSGFETAAIDGNDALSAEEKLSARVELLETAIRDQRGILEDTLGVEADRAPQLFVPYKEVLPLYDAGLDLPDDVTVVWANDNFGYIRRFPDEAELARSGGHGLYYHASYWANFATSYLATSTAPLALVGSELSKAWERGIRRLWVDNIGGLKPLELEMDFFLRRAWAADRPSATDDVVDFVAQWVDSAYSGEHGARAGALYAEYSRVNQQRKIEHLGSGAFAQTGWGDEASRRLAVLRRIYDETNEILAALPEDERDSFFQVFALKIHMSYLTNAQFYFADRSLLASQQGKAAAADQWLAVSRQFDDAKRALIRYYNEGLSGGKWNGMFTPEAFPPPVMPLFPPGSPALEIRGHGLDATVWGAAPDNDDRGLTFWQHGADAKWIEVFSTGVPGVAYTIDADPWIQVTRGSGIAGAETRLHVAVDAAANAGRSGTIRITSPTIADAVEIPVRVAETPAIEPGFVGAVEADGVVSLDPARPDEVRDGTSSRWHVIPHLGRDGVDALQAEAVVRHPDAAADAAAAEFGFHLHTAGAHVLELHRLPTLDSTGRIRVAVTVDDSEPFTVESPTTDEHRGAWYTGIQDNVERLRVTLPDLEAGGHTLRLHVVDGAVTLTKLVIHTADEILDTNLGAPFSRHTRSADAPVPDPALSASALSEVDRVVREVYGVDPTENAILDQVYVDRYWFDHETTFRRTRNVPQTNRGAAVTWHGPDGTKDIVRALGTGAPVGADGRLAFEAELALVGGDHAWLTPSRDSEAAWELTQAETQARTGLALQARPRGLQWDDPADAPGMHFAIELPDGGAYRVWLLVKFDDGTDDACFLALDGAVQPLEAQFSGGDLCSYGTRQIWLWTHVSDLEITAGSHVLSIYARKSGLRVDRVYLTLGDELPPIDADWAPSARVDVAAGEAAAVTLS